MGRVKREREKQMTKEKMIKTRNNLQETELLSIGWTAHGFGSCFKKVAVIQAPGHPHGWRRSGPAKGHPSLRPSCGRPAYRLDRRSCPPLAGSLIDSGRREDVTKKPAVKIWGES